MCPLSLSSKYYNTNLIILALQIAMLVESDTLSKPILTDFQIYSPLQNTLTKLIPLWYLVVLSVRVEGFRSHLHLTMMLLQTKKGYWKRAKGIHQRTYTNSNYHHFSTLHTLREKQNQNIKVVLMLYARLKDDKYENSTNTLTMSTPTLCKLFIYLSRRNLFQSFDFT